MFLVETVTFYPRETQKTYNAAYVPLKVFVWRFHPKLHKNKDLIF